MLNWGASILAATISPARVHGHIFDMSLHIYSVMLRYYWKHMWCCIGVQISPETFLFGSPHCTNLDLESTWLPSENLQMMGFPHLCYFAGAYFVGISLKSLKPDG